MARRTEEATVVERVAEQPAEQPAEVLEAVEVLAARHKVAAWALAGLMRRKRWATGKLVAESTFLGELQSWLGGPAGGAR